MASQADPKADAAAEKAYAEAAEQVSPKSAALADAAKVLAPSKIEQAVAAEAKAKAAPKKEKKAAAKKAPAPKAKAKPVRKAPVKPKPAAKAKTPAAVKITPAKPAKPTISELKDKIMATAKTTDFTKTVKDAATDLQARAKAAYEKSQAYAGEVTEFTKGNVEAVVESGKILATGMQDLARGEVEAAKGAFETVTADMKALAAVKSPTELFQLQGEIARRNFDAAVARFSKNAEVSLKLANDAFAPLSSRMSVAAEKISKAA